MPPTFSGNYIKEPEDFLPVTSEPQLLQAFDDEENPAVPHEADTFAELEANHPDVFAAVIIVANEVIRDAEQMVEAYARSQNYSIPLVEGGQPDPTVKSIAIRLAWIAARQRRRVITTEQAELERERLQRGELRDIARGVLALVVGKASDSPALASNVYAVTSNERVFSRDRLEGL